MNNNNSSNSLNKTHTNYNSNKSHNNNSHRYSFRTRCSFPTKTLELASTTIITIYRNKPSRIGDRWLNMSNSRWWNRWCSHPKNLSFNVNIHIRVYININIHRLPPLTRLHHTPIPCHHNLVHSSSSKLTIITTLNNKISNSKTMTTWSVAMGWRGCPVRWDDEWWDSNPIE